MTAEITALQHEKNEEIRALIEVLHASGKRLEELTAGEVDTVSSDDGRITLLHHAQEHMRHHEAAKQAAILDALPLHIALLDEQGVIVSVNVVWRQFAGENALHNPDCTIGANYLAICDRVQGDAADEARQVAAGIRAVLCGEVRYFSFDYACHTATEQRWFQVTANPLSDERPTGVVLMLQDISGRKNSAEEQRELRQLLDNIIDNIPTAVLLASVQDDRLQVWNKAAEAMFGLPRAAAIGRPMHDLWPALQTDQSNASDMELMVQSGVQDFPDRLLPTVGRRPLHAHVRKVALFDDEGRKTHRLVIADDITERRRADQEFKDLLEFAPDAMVIVDHRAEILRVNSQTVTLFGWSREELLGKKIEILVPESKQLSHPESRNGFFAHPEIRTMGGGRHLLARRKDGSEFPVEISLSPLQTEKGSLVMAAIRDISERELAERKTRLLAARLTRTLESISDAFYTVDREWRITYVNIEAERMFEQQRDDLIGKVLWDAFPHLDESDFGRGYRHAMRENSTQIFEAFFAPWATWYRANAYPSEDGLTVYLRDVTAERGARQQLELLEASVARLNDMVVITEAVPYGDIGRRIVFVNDSFMRFTGYSRDDVLGKSSRLLQGPATDPAVVERIYAGLENFQPVHAELVNYRKNGESYWGEIDIVPISVAGAPYSHFVAIERDISERKRAEDELRALNADLESRVCARTAELNLAREEAEQANRAKSDFLAVMSHEIRTPMNGVIGMIDVLEQSSLNSEQVKVLQVAHESAYALLTIVNDVLDFSKIEAGQFLVDCEPMDVAAVLEGVCNTLDQLAVGKGAELLLFTDPGIPAQVLGDAARLRQVLLNLVGNAIKFSSSAGRPGRISLRVSLHQESAQPVLEFSVADNGIGMDKETLSRLFTPFTQADASTTRLFGGTGLGLSISHGLVKLMGGEITAHSDLGQGATFRVRLPLQLPANAPEAGAPELELAGLCCLVLGGEAVAVDDLSIYLEFSGATVYRVVDQEAARHWFESCPSDLCIVIVADDVRRSAATLLEWRRCCPSRPELDVRFVVLERGQRRGLRARARDLISLDRNLLSRRLLVTAVAVLAGRVAAPMADALPPAQIGVPRLVLDTGAQGPLILVAEDNEINRQVLLQQLALLGLKADIAETGRAALESWRYGNYALLLTDLRMPQMDGYELALAIRLAEDGRRHMPIVALSANALKSEVMRCREVGMDDFLTKPFRLEDLRAMLRKWLPEPSTASPLPVTALIADAFIKRSPHPTPLAGRMTGIPVVAKNHARIPVDLTILVALVGDDPEVIAQMLKAFRSSAVKSSQTMRQAVVASQASVLGDAAHTLKSGARSLGAHHLGELCAEIELHAPVIGSDALTILLQRFEIELLAVFSFLDSR